MGQHMDLYGILIPLGIMVVSTCVLAYLVLTGFNQYWEMQHVEYVQPQILFGNFYRVIVNKENFVLKVKELYDAIIGPFGGIFLFLQPILIIRDPKIIQQMLLIDYDKFTDRGLLTSNLLVLKGQQWRPITDIIEPMFASDMRRNMFDALKKTSETLHEHVQRKSKSSNIFEIQDLMVRFASASTALTVFSMEVDSINSSEDLFYKIGRLIATPTRFGQLQSLLELIMPSLVNYFNIRTMHADIENVLRKAISKSLQLRECGKITEHDYMQLLVQLRNNGQFNVDGKWDIEPVDEASKHQTIDEVIAQLFLFYVIIFDTSSSAASFALFEIARNKKIQLKLQSEIDVIVGGAELTDTLINKLQYLDQVVSETLRKYPSVPVIARSPLVPYHMPDTLIVMNEDHEVFLPIYALHHDPDYFEQPANFDPDRFKSNIFENRKPRIYYPFGDASRTCMRSSYALVQIKVAIITLCSKFNLELAPNRSPDIKFCTVGSLNVEGNLHLQLTSRIVTK